jgi:hypothetical protein
MDNLEDDEVKLVDSPTSSSSGEQFYIPLCSPILDDEAGSSCHDSISSEVYVRRPGMVKSMWRRLRVSFF